VPATLASSLRDIQGHGEREAQGENKGVIEDVKKLIKVRSGPLFLLAVCV